MSHPGVLITKPLALYLAKLYGRAIPLPSLDKASRNTDRAPGAQLCYVQMVIPEEGSDLNAQVLLSVCGYNPGDRLKAEEVMGLTLPEEGESVWVIRVFDPTEEVNGQHCPPHWVPLDTAVEGSSGGSSGSDTPSDGSGSGDGSGDGSGGTGGSGDGSGDGSGGTGGTGDGSGDAGSGGTTGSGSGSHSGSGGTGNGTGGTGGTGNGSGKDTAIVPVSWFQKGYAALFVLECPEVRFDDVLIVVMSQVDATVEFDWRYVEVCEPDSIEACGHSSDLPALFGVVVSGDTVRVTFEHQQPNRMLRLVMRMTGIRKGFAGTRFPERSARQFVANNAHIDSAYPRE